MTTAISLSNVEQELEKHPKELFWDFMELYQWKGFWYNTTSMKGTTWLKTLCSYIMGDQRISTTDHDQDQDQLLVKNPHFHVRTFEYEISENSLHPEVFNIPSPRLFHTHLPYSALPEKINNSECKIVYVTRNPKDTLVSLWHYYNKIFVQPNQEPYPFEKAYDAFCEGVVNHGPYFDHVFEYWSASLKMPERILFLKYEDLKRDTKGEVKRLAAFLGRPFDNEDEADNVIRKSSLERLKNLEVNKNGRLAYLSSTIPNSSFFRLGVVGDWKNHFTPEMKQHLDEITCLKLEGSGLYFET